MESPRRSLVKALCWNALGLAMMSLVGLVMTGSAALGGAMAAIDRFSQSIVLIRNVFIGDDPAQQYQDAVAAIERDLERLGSITSIPLIEIRR